MVMRSFQIDPMHEHEYVRIDKIFDGKEWIVSGDDNQTLIETIGFNTIKVKTTPEIITK